MLESTKAIGLLEEQEKLLKPFLKDKLTTKDKKLVAAYEEATEGGKIVGAKEFFAQLEERKKSLKAQEKADKAQEKKEKKALDALVEEKIERATLAHKILDRNLAFLSEKIDRSLTSKDEWTLNLDEGGNLEAPVAIIAVVVAVNNSFRKEFIRAEIPFNFKPKNDKLLPDDEPDKDLSQEEFVEKKFIDEIKTLTNELGIVISEKRKNA